MATDRVDRSRIVAQSLQRISTSREQGREREQKTVSGAALGFPRTIFLKGIIKCNIWKIKLLISPF